MLKSLPSRIFLDISRLDVIARALAGPKNLFNPMSRWSGVVYRFRLSMRGREVVFSKLLNRRPVRK